VQDLSCTDLDDHGDVRNAVAGRASADPPRANAGAGRGGSGYPLLVRDHLPKLFLALVVAGVVFAGTWGYASYDLHSRVANFRRSMTDLPYARGGNFPDEAAALAHVQEVAQAARVDVDDVAVDIREEAGLDAAGKILNQRAASAGAPGVSMTMRRYRFTGHIEARKWLWSKNEALDVTVSKRGRVELNLPPRRY